MTGEIEIVRADDPRATALLADGWTVVAESWGARLRLGEPPALDVAHAAVADAERAGYEVRELDASSAVALHDVERANHDDYPVGPATSVPDRTLSDAEALWTAGRVFGALRQGQLVAATVIEQQDGAAETTFTSVLAAHRRRGLAVAVKAASIIALATDGARVFGTGGAAVNAGSIRMNEHLGYVVEERWLSLAAPA